MYSRTVLEHFTNPRNVGVMEHPDAYARYESKVHNDLVEVFLRIDQDRIVEIKYRIHGCAAAIAASSMASEMAKGHSLEEAERMTPQEVADALGGLPEGKIDCSVLLPDALRQAIADYRQGQESAASQALG